MARLAWRGDFLGNGSLARVNRELARAIVALDRHEIVPLGEATPAVEATLGVTAQRRESLAPGVTDLTLRHRWPPYVMNPHEGRYVHIQPWEMGAAPRVFAEELAARADEVWCYSHYVRDVYLGAGFAPGRVHVIPLGVDPEVFHMGVEPLPELVPEQFVFLFVGGATQRKGVPILIDAYTRAFRAGEDVALVIKGTHSFFPYPGDLGGEVRALAERKDIPRIRYLDVEYSDAELARVYRTANVLVHPYRGEGFGLTVLEAMACGTPPIVSSGGATDDFVNAALGFPVPARRIAIGEHIDGVDLAGPGWLLDVDPGVLATTMRQVFEQRGEARARGQAAAAAVRDGWTWAHAAHRAIERIEALLRTPPRPVLPISDALDEFGDDAAMLGELFARLRVVEPALVEIGAPSDAVRELLVRWGWRALPPGAAPDGFDLLSAQGSGDAPAAWELAARRRPRVVRLAAGEAPAAGYAALAETSGGAAIFLRDDLIAHADLAVLTTAMARRRRVW